MSYITGFVIRPLPNGGCSLGYIAHCDPQGALPPWLVNKVTHTLGPRMVKDLRKAALGYIPWKRDQTHNRKPWRNPEEICCPRIAIEDVSSFFCCQWLPNTDHDLDFTQCLATPPPSGEKEPPPQGNARRSMPSTPTTERPAPSIKDLSSSSNPLKFRKSLRLGKK